MENLAYHWPLDGDTRAAVGGSDAVAGRVAWVPDGWVSERRAPSEGGARLAAHFTGDALGAEAAFARASVSGLTLAALSVTLLVRLGPAAPEWITLWSFDALGGGLRCEVSDTGDA